MVFKQKCEDSSSFSSSDSDDKKNKARGRCTKKKKLSRSPHKKHCKKGYSVWLPCFNVRNRFRSCITRMRCGWPCMTTTNARCFSTYGLILLTAILLYFYGSYLKQLVAYVFNSPLFMSTNTIVDRALAKYSADKVGLADYALESGGGSILCSSNTYYSRNGALYSIFGVPLWYHTSAPREIIQPDVQPGKCWAMDGESGYVAVQLSMPVVVDAITLEHIPPNLAPQGRVDSAPKDFVIMGKESSMDSPDVMLGTFRYKIDPQHPIQTFPIRDPYCTRITTDYTTCGPNLRVFSIIELRILSNYGNPEYTCIYRLRVHGRSHD